MLSRARVRGGMTMLLILTVLMLTCPPAQGQGDEHEEEEGCPGLGAGEERDHFGVDDEGQAGAFCYHLDGGVDLVAISYVLSANELGGRLIGKLRDL